MAFADFDAYTNALKNRVAANFQLSSLSASSRWMNSPSLSVPAPTNPTSSVALDKTNTRAINGEVPNGGAGRLSILGGSIGLASAGAPGPCPMLLIDILNISGGLDGTVTTAQTTNLPTAALTRYTSGEGVCIAIPQFAAVGSTATTLSVSYTNQDGTSGRVSPTIAFSGGNNGLISRLPLQAGDTGVRSVESVTLAGSTGSAGNFGVMLYKPLAMLFPNDTEQMNVFDCVSTGKMVGQFNEVLDDACLSLIHYQYAASPVITGSIFLGEA